MINKKMIKKIMINKKQTIFQQKVGLYLTKKLIQ